MLPGATEIMIHTASKDTPDISIRIPPIIVKMAITVTPVGLLLVSN